MANTKSGNTFYIDTQYSVATDELQIKGIRVPYILISSSSGTNSLVLVDSITLSTKFSVKNLNNPGLIGDSRVFDFHSNPLLFPNGIRPATVSNVVVTCVFIDPRS